MAKYYRPFIKCTNWALSGLLTLFGFSCGKDEVDGGDGGMRLEYGTPSATYAVKGKVLDRSESQPVPDMQVIVKYDPESEYSSYYNDTVYTDQKGLFESSAYRFPNLESVQVITGDETNDVFLPDTTDVSFEDAKFVGGSGWHAGKAEKEVTIYLEKKEAEDE